MWNKISFLILLVTLASINCEKRCPNECKCDYQKNFAECYSLPNTHFEERILKLIIDGKGKAGMMLESDTFTRLKLNELSTIHFQNITIKSINPDSFRILKNLECVQITDANLNDIDSNIFNHNRKLKIINLSNNPLRKISSYLLNTSYIEEIILRNCNINNPSKTTFTLMPSLTFIDLTNNGIEKIDIDTFNTLKSIQEIDLSDNHLTKIYGNLFSLDEDENMDILKLNRNPLSTTEGLEVSNLDNLELNNCKIRTITQSMFKGVPNLMKLTLTSNGINQIHPYAFKYLETLLYIDLSKNELSTLPKKLFYNTLSIINIKLGENPNLKRLPEGGFISRMGFFDIASFNISHCSLESLEDNHFNSMIMLNELYLNNNNLKEINKNTFWALIHLKILDLSYNKIHQLNEKLFDYNPNLQTLNLAGNPLKTFSMTPFKTSSNLIWLDISNCQLTDLWETPQQPVDFLTNLKFLNVSFNEITNVNTTQLKILKSLNILDITYNPLECTEQLANLIAWLGDNKVVPAVSPTHMDISFSDRKRYISLQNKEQWEELAKSRCQVTSVQTSSIENTIKYEDDDDDDDDEDDENDEDDYEYYDEKFINTVKNDMSYADLKDNGKNKNSVHDKESEHYLNRQKTVSLDEIPDEEEVNVKPITFGTYVSVWTATMILVATISFVSILTTLTLIKRYQMKRNTTGISKTSISKKNCGLVYRPLSEDVTEPNTPVFTRFIDSYTSNNGIHKSNIQPENV